MMGKFFDKTNSNSSLSNTLFLLDNKDFARYKLRCIYSMILCITVIYNHVKKYSFRQSLTTLLKSHISEQRSDYTSSSLQQYDNFFLRWSGLTKNHPITPRYLRSEWEYLHSSAQIIHHVVPEIQKKFYALRKIFRDYAMTIPSEKISEIHLLKPLLVNM